MNRVEHAPLSPLKSADCLLVRVRSKIKAEVKHQLMKGFFAKRVRVIERVMIEKVMIIKFTNRFLMQIPITTLVRVVLIGNIARFLNSNRCALPGSRCNIVVTRASSISRRELRQQHQNKARNGKKS